MFSLLRTLFTGSSARRPAVSGRPMSVRPGMEVLEARTALSTVVWDGSADGSNVRCADARWSSPQNWAGDVAPAAGDDLVFPASALQLAAVNDYPSGTVFRSLF